MRGDRLIWVLVWLVMLGAAWVYAATLTTPVPAQLPLLPLDVAARPVPADVLHPLSAAGAPADPFAPQVGGQSQPPAVPLPPPPVLLPPPPLPEPAVPPGTAAPAEAPPFKVTGIVSGPVKRAVLEVKDTAYIVKEGDTVEGWTVVRIESSRVILRNAEGSELVLTLEAVPPPPPAAPSP